MSFMGAAPAQGGPKEVCTLVEGKQVPILSIILLHLNFKEAIQERQSVSICIIPRPSTLKTFLFTLKKEYH